MASKRVLVIDDSNTIRRSAEIFLVQAGCRVVLAEDGFDALAKIADHQPSVIFCERKISFPAPAPSAKAELLASIIFGTRG